MFRAGIVLVACALIAGCASSATPAASPAPTTIPSNNAADIYRAALAHLPQAQADRDSLLNVECPLGPEVDRVLTIGRRSLELARQARAVAECGWNITRDGFNADAGEAKLLNDLDLLSRTIIFQARVDLSKRRYADAAESIADAWCLARRIATPLPLEWRWVGFRIEHHALDVAARFVALADEAAIGDLRDKFLNLPHVPALDRAMRATIEQSAEQLRNDFTARTGQQLSPGQEPRWMRKIIEELDHYADRVIALRNAPLSEYEAERDRIDREIYRAGAVNKITQIAISSLMLDRFPDDRIVCTRAAFLAGCALKLDGQAGFRSVIDPLSGRPFELNDQRAGPFTVTSRQPIQRNRVELQFTPRP